VLVGWFVLCLVDSLVGWFFGSLVLWLIGSFVSDYLLLSDFGPYGILCMTVCLYYFRFYLYSLRVICYCKNVNIATEVMQRQ
jgi:hypothetical protein